MPVPRNWNKVLTATYGDWHLFPRSGILHHGIQGTSVKDLASQSGTSMSQIKEDLLAMLASFE